MKTPATIIIISISITTRTRTVQEAGVAGPHAIAKQYIQRATNNTLTMLATVTIILLDTEVDGIVIGGWW